MPISISGLVPFRMPRPVLMQLALSDVTTTRADTLSYHALVAPDLSESISRFGVLQPIIVRESTTTGRYELVAGRRRVSAARMLSLESIPALVFPSTTPDALLHAIGLVENTSRGDSINFDVERIRVLRSRGFSARRICRELNISRREYRRRARLLTLIPALLERLAGSWLSLRLASKLATISQDAQLRVATDLSESGRCTLTPRDVENVLGHDWQQHFVALSTVEMLEIVEESEVSENEHVEPTAQDVEETSPEVQRPQYERMEVTLDVDGNSDYEQINVLTRATGERPFPQSRIGRSIRSITVRLHPVVPSDPSMIGASLRVRLRAFGVRIGLLRANATDLAFMQADGTINAFGSTWTTAQNIERQLREREQAVRRQLEPNWIDGETIQVGGARFVAQSAVADRVTEARAAERAALATQIPLARTEVVPGLPREDILRLLSENESHANVALLLDAADRSLPAEPTDACDRMREALTLVRQMFDAQGLVSAE